MNTVVRLLEALPGAALLVLTGIAFARLRPRNGVPHRWMSSRLREEVAVLSFVTAISFGFALLLQGLIGFTR